MNDIAHKQSVQKAVKAKFRGNQKLYAKYHTKYPEGIEREFQRATDAYMMLVNQAMKKHLPEIKQTVQAERSSSERHDGISDLSTKIDETFAKMGIELEKADITFGLRKKLESLANMSRKLSIKEWKKAVKATLGIDLMDDYYLDEFYRESLTRWIDENVNLIKTIPQETLSDMHNIVLEGFKSGKTTTSIVKEIQHTYGVKRSSARLLARDQLSKLNGEIAKAQQQDAGVEEYIWSDSGDGRVRKRHKQLNGKKFRWDDPPVIDTRTGRRGNPGDDYQCRCVALPVFDIETVDLPIAGNERSEAEMTK